MKTVTLASILHTALVKIQLNPPSSVFGICSELKEYIDGDIRYEFVCDASGMDYDETVSEAFQAWPKYSGDAVYPVPCPDLGSPMSAFSRSRKMWDATDPYGALRLELLDFMINYFEQKL